MIDNNPYASPTAADPIHAGLRKRKGGVDSVLASRGWKGGVDSVLVSRGLLHRRVIVHCPIEATIEYHACGLTNDSTPAGSSERF